MNAKKRQLTQQQLADAIYVHRKTYSTYETGRAYVPLTIFIRLLNYYGYTIELKNFKN